MWMLRNGGVDRGKCWGVYLPDIRVVVRRSAGVVGMSL